MKQRRLTPKRDRISPDISNFEYINSTPVPELARKAFAAGVKPNARVDEIAKAIGLPPRLVFEIKQAYKTRYPYSLETLGSAEDYKNRPDAHSVIEEIELVDLNIDIESSVENRFCAREIDKVLNILDPKEKKILQMRKGLGDYPYAQTLEEVGDVFGQTKERIRQLEMKALGKLRAPQAAEKLEPYYCQIDPVLASKILKILNIDSLNSEGINTDPKEIDTEINQIAEVIVRRIVNHT